MAIQIVNAIRQHTGFVMLGISGAREEYTETSLALDEEYWLALRHPAEAQSAGFALLTSNHPGFAALTSPEKLALWKEFRAYIRQAEGFYRGAAVLPWKSSPLNHYYAFLNLAKAAVLARGLLLPQPAAQPRVIRHGVSAEVLPGTPDQWMLKVRNPADVFGLLYGLSLGTSIAKGIQLEAHTLLSYVMPIHWQMGKSGYGAPPIAMANWLLIVNQPTNQYWDLIVVDRNFPIANTPAPFQALYQEIDPVAARPFAWHTLKLHAVQANSLRFLERVTPVANPFPALENSIRSTAPYLLQENLVTKEAQIALSLACPTVGGGSVPMSELVASYGVMYFLSSLVRYHPDYMDSIGESSDAWLIESFAKSTPLLLLRSLTREILGYPLKIMSM